MDRTHTSNEIIPFNNEWKSGGPHSDIPSESFREQLFENVMRDKCWFAWPCVAIDFSSASLTVTDFNPHPAGLLSDQFCRRWPLVSNRFLLSLLSVGFGLVKTFPPFLALRTLFGGYACEDLGDLDDPHLRASRASTTRPGPIVEDDDPYLRLDEEDPMSRNNAQSIPPIASGGDFGPEPSSKGLLAHHASPLRNYPSDSSSDRSSISSEDVIILFLTPKPSSRYKIDLSYTTFLHSVPLLCILITVGAPVSHLHTFLEQIFIKPVMIASSFFIPVALFTSAIWVFTGSFMWDADTKPTWGETAGLRLLAIIPLVLDLLTARRLVDLPREIHTASSLLTLATRLLQNNPFLLGPPPLVLLASLIVSIPFLTLTFRLLLIGYPILPGGNPSIWGRHVRGWAIGLLRWFLPSGYGVGLLIIAFRRFPAYLPLLARPFLQPPVFVSAMAVEYLENATSSLSTYALAYLGLTGDPFSRHKRKFKNDPPFTMLAYAPLTLTLQFALTAYLFVAHTLGTPQRALWAAILGGGVTALVGLFCVGLVDDTVDALYVCYCIDQQAGQKRRPEVFSAFEYETKKPQQQQTRPVPGSSGL
ncbi:hypothetical protein BJ322DRAFT_1110919 [Thelephora terrestris]|uniref:Uncharacterized protein n=1 Tax=Thelephora terrestris TaxID=56493 RepID=A0A9P6HBR4_9AGAM|nr:hypothetical protein BJ322DRAFT_1110919 [Thelephora terrestris]